MQIFELTQKQSLREYDPDRLPPKKNFGSGVGPGVQPQYTATPRMKSAPQPKAAPQLPPPSGPGAADATTAAAKPEPPYIDAPAQLTGPAPQQRIGTTFDPNVIDVDAREVPTPPPSTPQPGLPAPPSQLALPAPQTATAPPAPSPQPAPAPAPQPAPAPPPTAVSTRNIGIQGPKTRVPGVMDTIAHAMQSYNAGKVGLGYLVKQPKIETDPMGKITVDGKSYNPKDPQHVQAVNSFIKRSNGRASMGSDYHLYIDGQKFNAQLPPHLYFMRMGNQGAGQQQVNLQALQGILTPQQIYQLQNTPQAQQKAILQQMLSNKASSGQQPTPESLEWSKSFDPSRTLLEKIRSQK